MLEGLPAGRIAVSGSTDSAIRVIEKGKRGLETNDLAT
jgi:hypothetical protein